MVAQRVGRDRTYITNYLRLLRLPDSLQQLVEQEKLSMGHARALLGIEDPVLQTRIAHNIIERGMSVRETERTIRQIIDGKGLNTKTAPGQIERDDANLMAAESKMRRRLGTHVKLLPSHSGKGGKIEIEYYSDNDLHRLYQLIIGA
jgi:ParB family chromosome partitioning protein